MPEQITIADQIRCIRREIAMRDLVYPRRVAAHKMKQETADYELAAMRAVLVTIEEAERQRKNLKPPHSRPGALSPQHRPEPNHQPV